MQIVDEWFIAVPFIIVLLIIYFTDLRNRIIPDSIILPTIAAAILLRLWIHPLPYINYLLAAFVGSGIFYVISLIPSRNNQNSSIGGGDIKLLFLTGLILGTQLSFLSFLLFSFFGTIMGILLVLTRRDRSNQFAPFGPVIALATIISYVWGNDLYNWLFWNLFY